MGPLASPHAYTKPYKNVTDQISLLESRGIQIADKAAASACLQRIGYYRLSGYWYPFRKSHATTDPLTGRPQVTVQDDFRTGTTFQQVMDLYIFDKLLRLLFLDAIETIEVALRVNIALLIGVRDPWAHRDLKLLHGNFTKKINPYTGRTEYDKWLERLDETFSRSKEEFVKHFKNRYRGEKPPIWIAIELWDFGMLSVFLNGMKNADQLQLASTYGLPRADLLTTWCRNINNVRNICAHHSRLWNRSPADQISPPKFGEIAELNHLATDTTAQTRIYGTAAVLQFLLKTINPGSPWAERFKILCSEFPTSVVIDLTQAGFPKNWESLPLWA
jgi:abortive infection bacteriophage resistance protein